MSDEQMYETAETSAALAVSQLDQSYDAEVKNLQIRRAKRKKIMIF